VRKEVIKEETKEPRREAVEERTIIEAGRPVGLDWITVHKQLADQGLASVKAEFQKKEGAELDQCYMGQQIMAHMMTIDALKVVRNYASPELRKDLDETSQMATRHLDQAKKIAESMKGETGERVSRKPKADKAE
jgi:predicted outer membrane protein